MYRPDKTVDDVGWTHKRQDYNHKNLDCNEDQGGLRPPPRETMVEHKTLGPFVHQSLDLQGRTFRRRILQTTVSEMIVHREVIDCRTTVSISMLMNSLTQDVLNDKSPMLDIKNNSDF
jgi:hypothetical protein